MSEGGVVVAASRDPWYEGKEERRIADVYG
jgi:hypothetical protein